jgi:KUP system potassium uptake protein
VILSCAATIIASQALISGAFSLTRQAIELGFLPRMTIRHTSSATEGQIYVPLVNWALAAGCLLIVLTFRESSKLAAAYGIAVTGTMAITSITYFAVVRRSWRWGLWRALPLLLLFLAIDLPFLGANLLKVLDGGYVPIILAVALTVTMVIWKRGGSLVGSYHEELAPLKVLIPKILTTLKVRTPGTAVFLAHKPAGVSAMVLHYVSRIRSLHETVVLLSVETSPTPLVDAARQGDVLDLGHGFYEVVARHGFMEAADAPALLKAAVERSGLPVDLRDPTYFLGRESFMATARGHMGAVTEHIYAFLSRNATPADRHFKIPPERVVELGTLMDL